MENEIKVSVIVPVYNAEKYLSFTVDSLLSQTFRNIEVILVNDGSKDGSLELCQNYAKQDNRVKVIDKSNGGVSSARNCGIENASGDYVMFVDSDDLIKPEACEKIVANVIETNSDIIAFNFITKWISEKKRTEIFKDHNHGNEIITEKDKIFQLAKKLAFSKSCFYGASSVCTKAFNRDFLIKNKLAFELGKNHGEDWYFVLDALSCATKISFINDYLYVYTFYQDLKKEFLRSKVEQVTYGDLLNRFEKFKNRFPQFDYNSKAYTEFCYRGIFDLQMETMQCNNKRAKRYILTDIAISDVYNKLLSDLGLSKRKEYSKLKKSVLLKKVKNFLRGRKGRKGKKVLVRAYMQKNIGDDLFVYLLCKRFPSINFHVICDKHKLGKSLGERQNLFLINAGSLWNKLAEKIKFFSKLREKRLCKKFDTCVRIGGSIFFENKGVDYSKSVPAQFKNYFVIGANFGPYETEGFYNFYRKAFTTYKDVCFRDKYSFELFKDIKNVRYAPDVVFGLDKLKYQAKEVDEKGVLISIKPFNQDKENYRTYIANTINYCINEGYNVTLSSFCSVEGDEKEIETIFNLIDVNQREKIKILNYNGDIEHYLHKFSKNSYFVATRFHCMVLALVFDKRVLPIIYNQKQEKLIKDINGMTNFITLTDFANETQNLTKTKQFFDNEFNITFEGQEMAKAQFEGFEKFIKGV